MKDDDSSIVFDCSSVAAVLLQEQAGSDVAAVLNSLIDSGSFALVPALFWYEITNVLLVAERRGRLDHQDVLEAEMDLASLPIMVDESHLLVIRMRIREYAEKYDLSAYDAAYLELAERKSLRLKTLDKDLLRLQKDCPFIF